MSNINNDRSEIVAKIVDQQLVGKLLKEYKAINNNKPTYPEIAIAIGKSESTISRIVNNSGYYSDEIAEMLLWKYPGIIELYVERYGEEQDIQKSKDSPTNSSNEFPVVNANDDTSKPEKTRSAVDMNSEYSTKLNRLDDPKLKEALGAEFVSALRHLYDPEYKNAVCNLLHCTIRSFENCDEIRSSCLSYLPIIAVFLHQCTFDPSFPNEVEMSLQMLLDGLKQLSEKEIFSKEDISEMIHSLRNAIYSGNDELRLKTVKHIFYFLYENWARAWHYDITYTMLNHILMPLYLDDDGKFDRDNLFNKTVYLASNIAAYKSAKQLLYKNTWAHD